jgi:hypothetical protein
MIDHTRPKWLVDWNGDYMLVDFVLKHGRGFQSDERTFQGRKGRATYCFSNAGRMVLGNPSLVYVEGYVWRFKMAIHHGWIAQQDGTIIDPTLRPESGERLDYFGVPFNWDYFLRSGRQRKSWGILDRYYGQPFLELVEGRGKDFKANL